MRRAFGLVVVLAVLCGSAGAAEAARPVPTPIGIGPQYTLPAASAAVARGADVGRFACLRAERPRELAHVELFANGRVLPLPSGIGMAPPLRLDGGEVRGARCSYPIRTVRPTGVVEFLRSVQATLGDVFDVWGQPLSATRLASFHSGRANRVKAWVDGGRWPGDIRAIPLRRHAQIVVELGGYVPPHTSYLFPSGG
jgi:hypothetical protein